MTTDDKFDQLSRSLGMRRSGFFPVDTLDDKRNFKRLVRIERDGSLVERVFLDVPDPSLREEIVCMHYLRHAVRIFLEQDVGVNILGRDCPWDFDVELSSGDRFFIEVTSIADSKQHFIINRREERLTRWHAESEIPLHELQRLSEDFPSRELKDRIRELSRENSATDLVPNPLNDSRPWVPISSMLDVGDTLETQIRNALEKKEAKRHEGKEKTVVILDNRTSAYDVPDYQAAARALASDVESMPFREIWFYTGYCSDNDGNNAEFSFAPLKVTSEQSEKLGAMDVDESGRHVWS